MRWEVRAHTPAVLLGAASRICSEQVTAYLCNSHLAFSVSILLKSKWCNHTVILTQLQLEKISISFYHKDQIFMRSITYQQQSMRILNLLSVKEILLPMYVN